MTDSHGYLWRRLSQRVLAQSQNTAFNKTLFIVCYRLKDGKTCLRQLVFIIVWQDGSFR